MCVSLYLEARVDEVFGSLANAFPDGLLEMVVALLDLAHHDGFALGVERHEARQHHVGQAADAPNVRELVASAREYFGRHRVQGADLI